MHLTRKLAAVTALALAVVALVIVKKSAHLSVPPATAPKTAAISAALPRLVDLGSHKCIPCQKMAPILEQLSQEFAAQMRVEFIDVRETPELAVPYGIRLIPTQIFFDASGRELARHEGYYSKEDILAQWSALGLTMTPKSQAR